MTLDEMKYLKKNLGLTCEFISKNSGVPLPTVQKIFSGSTSSPRYQTLKALEKLFLAEHPASGTQPLPGSTGTGLPPAAGESAARPSEAGDIPFEKGRQHGKAISCQKEENMLSSTASMVRETAAAYGVSAKPFAEKKQGEYTVEDYLNYPEDQRIELIDGVIYDMAAPILNHQVVTGQIYYQLCSYINGKKGPCRPFIAPSDVQLDRDNKTMVQPDVFIVCDPSKMIRTRLFGAPDFIVEVLSPSTKRKDTLIKAYKYQAAGVREYWMVDLDKEKVIVYLFEEENFDIFLYGLDDEVPVSIYNGDCRINFGEIREQLIPEVD